MVIQKLAMGQFPLIFNSDIVDDIGSNSEFGDEFDMLNGLSKQDLNVAELNID